jgi:gluconokinase
VNKELILGLDIGSSSVRAAIFDADANPIPHASVTIERTFRVTSDGGSEIDTALAIDQVVAAIDQVLDKASKLKGDISRVASCSFWHSLVGANVKGNPTTPVLTWADRRSREYTPVLQKHFVESEVHNRTGAHFHSSFWPAKLFWFRREQPNVWARTTRWLSLSDLVAERLFGEAVTSVSMASATGMFDQRKCDWDGDLLRYLKVKRASLPRIADDGEHFTLIRKYARRWPSLAKAKWLPAIGDGAADHLGSCGISPEWASLMIGTSAAMRVTFEGEPPDEIPDGLWCYRIDRRRVIIGGALSDGGGLYDWLERNLRIDMPDAAMATEMARRGADARGLTFMPFLAGERSTGYNEDATGSIHGLTMAHDAIDILQAAMESVAFRFADIFDRLGTVAPVYEIVASGGALAASPVWTQIIADVLGRDLTVSNNPEASLRGAVLLALATTGKIELADKSNTNENLKIDFHPECHSVYRKARKRHLGVLGTLSDPNK